MFEIEDLTPGDKIIRNEASNGEKVLFSQSLSGNWGFYADGYKLAADMLVDQIEGNPPEDCLICPVLFMYRHWVELKLKDLIINLDVLSATEIVLPFRHDLYELWSAVKSNLDCLRGGNGDTSLFDLLDSRIKELHQLDPDGYHFRYPHNKKFEKLALPESLGMKNLKYTMNKISYAFALIDGGIDYERDYRTLDAELEAEMRSYSSWE